MSETPSDTDAQREALAAAFGQETDPLAEYAGTFERMDIDPFEIFIDEVIRTRDIADNTLAHYEAMFRHWEQHMDRMGRHPACPNESHVKQFARYELEEKDNHPDTVKEKLRKLASVYEYWQADPTFPHPEDYNPVELARSKTNFEAPKEKEVRRIPREELREVIQGVTHVRDRAIIVLQLKLGLRASELANIRLSEIALGNSEANDHYTELGTHRMLEGRQNVVYIPCDREGNKSRRPRVLPLDDETRRVLLRYLLIRPDTGAANLFLSKDHNEPMGKKAVNRVWKQAFHPEYAETEQYRSVTSHYGRHYFTTFWTVEEEANRELVKYMRGDTTSRKADDGPPGAIETYIHTYFEDIEDLYRENIFKLRV
ncbi:tyrosine-type recombinase/integrase [Haloglomus salinum]|uniref:tyrosine-type recombinase/integrase n=1 Tax=Haloglomus salinum TaxID=2962673 RepID=UPI0020C9A493|nr:tyrosine-type recombinase/integrase [Haloglomus salinum]